MIWYLTKGNHKWSIHPLVRAWLRAGGLTRFVVIAAASAGLSFLVSPVFSGIALIFGRGEFGQFIGGLPKILIGSVWILWVIDAYMDNRTTRGDLAKLRASPNVVLATRGEYIGGHPQLPHGRFVYLTLGGRMENPQLNILLPQASGRESIAFAMPVLDLYKASERADRDDSDLGRTLASIVLQSSFLVQHATLRTEYTAQAGRKQQVELSYFLGGNGEIQNWRNYVICIQAEADTGNPPYGPWKSLPAGRAASSGAPLWNVPSSAAVRPKADSPGASTANVSPRRTAGVGDAQASPVRTERPLPATTPPVEQPPSPVNEKSFSASPASRIAKAVPLAEQSIGASVFCVAFSRDSRALAVASASGICLCDGKSLAVRTWIKTESEIHGLAFSPDGGILVAGLSDRTVRLWRYPGGEPLKTLEGHNDEIWSVAFSPDGKMLASGGDDMTLRLWQASGELLRIFRNHSSVVRSVAFSPDGGILASGSGGGDEKVCLWRVADGTLLHVLGGHMYGVRSVAFSPDGKVLASGAGDRLVQLRKVSDTAAARVLEGHEDGVSSVAFSPNGKILASGAMDRTIRLWLVAGGALVETLEGHKSGVKSVAFSLDGLTLASGAEDGTVLLWGARG